MSKVIVKKNMLYRILYGPDLTSGLNISDFTMRVRKIISSRCGLVKDKSELTEEELKGKER